MNERIKELRKTLGLTLEKFGSNLGVTKTAIYNIENGNRKLTDQMFISICREFNVNENWLRTGDGDMFIELPEEDEYFKYATQLSDDPMVVSCLVEYGKLRPEEKEVVKKYLINAAKRIIKEHED